MVMLSSVLIMSDHLRVYVVFSSLSLSLWSLKINANFKQIQTKPSTMSRCHEVSGQQREM